MNFGEYYINESVIKDVVYHGTNTLFSKFNFDNAPQKIIWFSSTPNKITDGESGAAGTKYILKLKVNIKNPAGWDEYDKYGLDTLQQMKYDGVILPDKNGYDGFVFKPSQVKILGVLE